MVGSDSLKFELIALSVASAGGEKTAVEAVGSGEAIVASWSHRCGYLEEQELDKCTQRAPPSASWCCSINNPKLLFSRKEGRKKGNSSLLKKVLSKEFQPLERGHDLFLPLNWSFTSLLVVRVISQRALEA